MKSVEDFVAGPLNKTPTHKRPTTNDRDRPTTTNNASNLTTKTEQQAATNNEQQTTNKRTENNTSSSLASGNRQPQLNNWTTEQLNYTELLKKLLSCWVGCWLLVVGNYNYNQLTTQPTPN